MTPTPPMSIPALFSVTGKTALVTGGGSGIGRMVIEALAMGGAHVLTCSRRLERVQQAADEVNAQGHPGRVTAFQGDVGSEEGVAAIAAEVARHGDRLHVLVNNAGLTWGQKLGQFPWSAWGRVMDVNVAGLFQLTQALLPLLERAASEADPARVINLGSVMGDAPLGDGAYSYAASKAAVHHLTRILAKELAPRRITVNAFAPGPFPSRMTAFATADAATARKVGADVPLGRLGTPEDIAGATLYLCGRAGAYVTGAILPLSGGIQVQTGPDLFRAAQE